MKRHNLHPRPCSCKDTDKPCKCGGVIKPVSEFEPPNKFNLRKYCCVFCPALHERKKGYRHVKAEPKLHKQSAIDRYLMGAKP